MSKKVAESDIVFSSNIIQHKLSFTIPYLPNTVPVKKCNNNNEYRSAFKERPLLSSYKGCGGGGYLGWAVAGCPKVIGVVELLLLLAGGSAGLRSKTAWRSVVGGLGRSQQWCHGPLTCRVGLAVDQKWWTQGAHQTYKQNINQS